MGKIKDIIEKMNQRINTDKNFKSELLEACEDGLVIFQKGHAIRSTFFYVYIVVGPIKRSIGEYAPAHGCYGEPMVDLLVVCDGNYNSYYTVSLDELIKHGAKEIKEDE